MPCTGLPRYPAILRAAQAAAPTRQMWTPPRLLWMLLGSQSVLVQYLRAGEIQTAQSLPHLSKAMCSVQKLVIAGLVFMERIIGAWLDVCPDLTGQIIKSLAQFQKPKKPGRKTCLYTELQQLCRQSMWIAMLRRLSQQRPWKRFLPLLKRAWWLTKAWTQMLFGLARPVERPQSDAGYGV